MTHANSLSVVVTVTHSNTQYTRHYRFGVYYFRGRLICIHSQLPIVPDPSSVLPARNNLYRVWTVWRHLFINNIIYQCVHTCFQRCFLHNDRLDGAMVLLSETSGPIMLAVCNRLGSIRALKAFLPILKL